MLQDAETLARLGALCYVETYDAFAPHAALQARAAAEYTPARVADVLADPQSLSFVVEVDGVVCGYAQLRQTAPPRLVGSIRPVELAVLCTAPSHRGTGLGAVLMRHVLRAAADAQHATLWLRVWEGNARAVAFYRRWGFARVAHEPDLRSPLPSAALARAVVMARPLRTWQPDRHRGWTPLWLEFSHFAPG